MGAHTVKSRRHAGVRVGRRSSAGRAGGEAGGRSCRGPEGEGFMGFYSLATLEKTRILPFFGCLSHRAKECERSNVYDALVPLISQLGHPSCFFPR